MSKKWPSQSCSRRPELEDEGQTSLLWDVQRVLSKKVLLAKLLEHLYSCDAPLHLEVLVWNKKCPLVDSCWGSNLSVEDIVVIPNPAVGIR